MIARVSTGRAGLDSQRLRADLASTDRDDAQALRERAELALWRVPPLESKGVSSARSASGAVRHALCSSGESQRRRAMNPTTKELKAELDKSVEMLKTLRGEIRVKLHLAGMEAKDRWNKLQPTLDAAEQAAKDATDASRQAVEQAVKSLKELRQSFH
jgi:hypothetical protein